MTEEEMQELVQNALQKTLKEIKENPSNVFNYLELQKRYNGVLKDKVKLQQENQELKKQLEAKNIQQKEFIEWLEKESKELIRDAGYHQRICLDILEKYKEIIGGKDE